jgi:predicted ribonuclease toxin of YeeF-YezG toxin-antitoxin module
MIHLRNVIAVLALVVVIYLVTNYSGMIQQQIGVKGASTIRGQNIAGKISHDVGTQVDAAKDQAMHVNLSDVVSYFSRFQRVPQDISSMKNYAQDQVNNVLESKNKKK